MSAIDKSFSNSGSTPYLLNRLSESAGQSHTAIKIYRDRFKYKDLLETGTQLLNHKEFSNLKLKPSDVPRFVTNHPLFSDRYFTVREVPETNKYLVTRYDYSLQNHNDVKKGESPLLPCMQTVGLTALTLLSLPVSDPINAAALSYSASKKLYGTITKIHKKLTVEVLIPNEENRLRINEIMDIWENTAARKRLLTDSDSIQFENSVYIAGRIKKNLSDDNCAPSRRILVCYDNTFKNPQAVAIVENETDKEGLISKDIENLITNPINIRSEINENEKGRVTGAATAIIAKVCRMCRKESIDQISLASLPAAVTFYTDLGFIKPNKFIPLYFVLNRPNFL